MQQVLKIIRLQVTQLKCLITGASAYPRCVSRQSVGLERKLRSGNEAHPSRISLFLLKPPLTIFSNRISRNHVKTLEEKLDGIVSLLKSTHEIGSGDEHSSTSSVRPVVLLDQGSRGLPLAAEDLNRPTQARLVSNDSSCLQPWPPSTLKACDPLTRTFNGPEWSLVKPLPTSEEADALLEGFRNEMSSYFPFISVPESISADEYRRQRPFTYLAIITVTRMKYPQQKELGDIFLKQMAERVFVSGERSIDLLFGVLTMAAWYVPRDNVSFSFLFFELPNSLAL